MGSSVGRRRGTRVGLRSAAMAACAPAIFSGFELTQFKPEPWATSASSVPETIRFAKQIQGSAVGAEIPACAQCHGNLFAPAHCAGSSAASKSSGASLLVCHRLHSRCRPASPGACESCRLWWMPGHACCDETWITAMCELTQAHLADWPTQLAPDSQALAASRAAALAPGAKK